MLANRELNLGEYIVAARLEKQVKAELSSTDLVLRGVISLVKEKKKDIHG